MPIARWNHAQVDSSQPRRGLIALICVAVMATLVGAHDLRTASAAPGLVPEQVRTDLPVVVDGTVTDIEQVGNRIVVAGTFTQVQPQAGGATVDQRYLFAYDIDTGQFDEGFRPQFDKDIEQIAPAPDGSGIYVVGRFSTIDGVTKRKIARLNADGSLDQTFTANADAKATALALTPDGSRLFVGGQFTQINGEPRAGMAELDATDGSVDPGFTLGIEGGIGVGGALSVKGMAVTPDSRSLVVLAPARFIGGEERYGLAKISIQGDVAKMQKWRTRLFEDNIGRAGGQFWLRGFDMSPDGTFFVVTTSGGDRPPTNDVAIRFPVRGNGSDDVQPDWITRNFDSTYSAAIDDDVVYIGGHFQYTEAPGATDPYPGDPDRSYGFGGDQDASVPGDQVIARKQVAALDPDTGQALGWNPGANGFNGVYALEIIDRGLLLGHDGNIVADRAVGRHGFFDRAQLPDDDVELDTTIVSPLTGQQFDQGSTVTIGGLASSPAGVDRVQLTVLDLNRDVWLRPDGTWGSWAGLDATLGAAGDNQTGWTIDITLPETGTYELKAKTFDRAGDKDPTAPTIRLRAVSVAQDERPETRVVQTVVADPPGNVISYRGTATDDRGVQSVRVELVDLDDGRYLQPDGTKGNFHAFDAVVDEPGATGVNFTFEATVPNGNWRAYFIAIDSAGQRDLSAASSTQRIAVGDEAPTLISIDSPTANEEMTTGSPFTVSGTAVDDRAIKRVQVRVLNVTTGQGLRSDGTIGEPDGTVTHVGAVVANIDSPETTWSLAVPGLPPGRWQINAYAEDASFQRISITQYIYVTVPGTALPDVFIATPTAGNIDGPALGAAGRATDDRGVERVEVGLYFYGDDVNRAGWLDADGSFANLPRWSEAVLAEPGSTSTDWSFSRTLPFEGRWQVRVRSWDDAGQPSWNYRTVVVAYSPNDLPPTLELENFADGAVVTPGPLLLNGVVHDDVAIDWVRFYVRRAYWNEGPNPNDQFTYAGWFNGFVTQPGGTRSNFTISTEDLPSGAWFILVEAFDAAGNQSERLRVNFTVEVPDNQAPQVTVSSPAHNSIDTPALTFEVGGTASDDQGVSAVEYVVYDYQQTGYLLDDGSVTNEPRLAVRTPTLTDPGAGTTAWSDTVTVPADGRYYVQSFAYDTDGQRSLTQRWGGSLSSFWVTPGDARPSVAIVSPANGATVDPLVVDASASDDRGVDRFEVLIRDANNSTVGLRLGGEIGQSPQWIPMTNATGLGTTAASATFEVDRPAGSWRVFVRAWDDSGKVTQTGSIVVQVP
ncbi:MAG: Ig-like domain-containing protein [Acidimicrobiales bacterium]